MQTSELKSKSVGCQQKENKMNWKQYQQLKDIIANIRVQRQALEKLATELDGDFKRDAELLDEKLFEFITGHANRVEHDFFHMMSGYER